MCLLFLNWCRVCFAACVVFLFFSIVAIPMLHVLCGVFHFRAYMHPRCHVYIYIALLLLSRTCNRTESPRGSDTREWQGQPLTQLTSIHRCKKIQCDTSEKYELTVLLSRLPTLELEMLRVTCWCSCASVGGLFYSLGLCLELILAHQSSQWLSFFLSWLTLSFPRFYVECLEVV